MQKQPEGLLRDGRIAVLVLLVLVMSACTTAPAAKVSGTPTYGAPSATGTPDASVTPIASVAPAPLAPSATPTETATPVSSPTRSSVEIRATETAAAPELHALMTRVAATFAAGPSYASSNAILPGTPALASGVSLRTVISTTGPISAVSWSPDGSMLAYSVSFSREGEEAVEVRAIPDYRLVGRWLVHDATHLLWSLDNSALYFRFTRADQTETRGEETSIGVAHPGEKGWSDILPQTEKRFTESRWLGFGEWFDASSLTVRRNCGTACQTLDKVDVQTGAVVSLYPFGGTTYLISPDRRFLAVTSMPWSKEGIQYTAAVVPLPALQPRTQLSALCNSRRTSAQSWSPGDDLAVSVYPEGYPGNWPETRPEIRVANVDTRQCRVVARSALWAQFSPAGDRLAVFFVGRPVAAPSGPVTGEGAQFNLALLTWPAGELLAAQPVSGPREPETDFRLYPGILWSAKGDSLIFSPAKGGRALMDKDGQVRPVILDDRGNVKGIGKNGDVAALVSGEIWVLQVNTQPAYATPTPPP
jgi:hypothetical protein